MHRDVYLVYRWQYLHLCMIVAMPPYGVEGTTTIRLMREAHPRNIVSIQRQKKGNLNVMTKPSLNKMSSMGHYKHTV